MGEVNLYIIGILNNRPALLILFVTLLTNFLLQQYPPEFRLLAIFSVSSGVLRTMAPSSQPKEKSSEPPVIFALRGLEPGTKLKVLNREFHCHSTILKQQSYSSSK